MIPEPTRRVEDIASGGDELEDGVGSIGEGVVDIVADDVGEDELHQPVSSSIPSVVKIAVGTTMRRRSDAVATSATVSSERVSDSANGSIAAAGSTSASLRRSRRM